MVRLKAPMKENSMVVLMGGMKKVPLRETQMVLKMALGKEWPKDLMTVLQKVVQ